MPISTSVFHILTGLAATVNSVHGRVYDRCLVWKLSFGDCDGEDLVLRHRIARVGMEATSKIPRQLKWATNKFLAAVAD